MLIQSIHMNLQFKKKKKRDVEKDDHWTSSSWQKEDNMET